MQRSKTVPRWLLGCLLVFTLGQGCFRSPEDQGALEDDRYAGFEPLWFHEAAYFGNGRWAKTETFFCFWDRDDSAVYVLNRRTGAVVHQIPLPGEAVHGNEPLFIDGSKLYVFSESGVEKSRLVELETGRTILLENHEARKIRPAKDGEISFSVGEISFTDASTGHSWVKPFRKEGFSLLSNCTGTAAKKNVYVRTHIYEGRLRLRDIPGGGVTGKPVGASLKVYSREDGSLLWHLPQEKRLYFCQETEDVVLVECGASMYRAHDILSGKVLWKKSFDGAVYSGWRDDVFIFLATNSIHLLDARTGRTAGDIQLDHSICDRPFIMTSITPALYWSDGYLVCEEARGKDGKSITRFHYYGLPPGRKR
jgi:hypothetical protein